MANGHVGKQGSRWYYVHGVVDAESGRRRQRWQRGFSSRREAERALRESLTALDTGYFVEPRKMTLSEFVEQLWLPQLAVEVEGSTLESYERNMRVHVLPRIGGVRLQSLTANHLNELYRTLLNEKTPLPAKTNRRHDDAVYVAIAALRDNGWSYAAIAEEVRTRFPGESGITKDAVSRIVARSREASAGERGALSVKTVRYVHQIIRRTLRDAIRLGLITYNPASNASPPRAPRAKAHRTLWNAEQTQAFLHWARTDDERRFFAWAFIATSGDRRGANLGLRWQDINFEDGLATLQWTVTCVAHKIIVKPYGKSGNAHEIILDRATLAMLRSWRAIQAQEQLMMGLRHQCVSTDPTCNAPGYHDRDLVFCRPDGDYLHPDRFSREFQRAQRRYNTAHPDRPLPLVNLHALRHGWATLALEAGVSMKVVQDRLNHASERVTSDIYTHVRKPLQSDAAERVAQLIFGAD